MDDKDLLNTDNPMTLYDSLGAVDVRKLPLQDQAQETDRRLAIYIEWCLQHGRMATTPGMALCLGVEPDTFRQLARGVNTDGRPLGKSGDGEAEQYYSALKLVLKKYLAKASTVLFDLSQDKNQTAAALFGLKSMYDYREQPDKTQLEITIRYEDLLQEVDAYEQEQASE